MRARIPYARIGDVGFYQRAEIKDALALLRLATTPDDAQADEAFRRVINMPARGFGAKAMDIVEVEATWRRVPLLVALETALLPPKTRTAGLGFLDAIRRAGIVKFTFWVPGTVASGTRISRVSDHYCRPDFSQQLFNLTRP